MKIKKITTLTRLQSLAYAVVGLNNIEHSANDLDINLLYKEIEIAMKIYPPSKIRKIAKKIISEEGGQVKWMKK